MTTSMHDYDDDSNDSPAYYRPKISAARGKGNKDEDEVSKQSVWAKNGVNFYPSHTTVGGLPAGQYTISYSQGIGYFFVKSKLQTDDIFILEDSVTDDVMESMQTFWGSEEKYRSFGFLWKRGVLLYGPPGTGKTCTVQLLAAEVEKLGGISVYLTDPHYFAGLKTLRDIEPNKPLVLILEDIDSLINNYGESEILSLLDGEMQLDNVVFVATTNYIDQLPGRIKNRPSRFDVIRKVNFPSAENRASFLSFKNPRIVGTTELNDWVEASDGFSIAHLKELIISVECLDVPFDLASKRLRALVDSESNGMDQVEDVFQNENRSKSAHAAIASCQPGIVADKRG